MAIFFASIALLLATGSAGVEPVKEVRVADHSHDCESAVDRVLSKMSGRLLSVRPHEDRCTVTILILKEGQRPEKAVFREKYDEENEID